MTMMMRQMSNNKAFDSYTEIFEEHWRTLYVISFSIMSLAWPAYIFSGGHNVDHKFYLLLLASFFVLVAAIAHQSPANMNRRNLCIYRWNKPTLFENLSLSFATIINVYIFFRFIYEFIINVIS